MQSKNIAIGQRIKKIRVSRNETLEQFANAIQITANNSIKTTKSNVSKWEKGLNIPNDIALNAIAEIGGVSVDYLMGISDSETDFSELLKFIFDLGSDSLKETFVENNTEFSETVSFSTLALAVTFDEALESYNSGNLEAFHDLRYIYWFITNVIQGTYGEALPEEQKKILAEAKNPTLNLSAEERKEQYESDKEKLIQILDKYAFKD